MTADLQSLLDRCRAATGLNEEAPSCSECSGAGKLTDGRTIYPHRPDLYAKAFYRCDCGAYVGCHPGTKRALGTPAGPETRRARSAAHAAFDPLWKSGRMKRSAAYRALAERLNIPAAHCHISWMDAATCAAAREAAALIAQQGTKE